MFTKNAKQLQACFPVEFMQIPPNVRLPLRDFKTSNEVLRNQQAIDKLFSEGSNLMTSESSNRIRGHMFQMSQQNKKCWIKALFKLA